MYPMKLTPVLKDYLWGGTRLKEEYGKASSLSIVAESWEVSCHPDGPSLVSNGPYRGQTLAALLREHPDWMGQQCAGMAEFPLLIKLIDAKQDLSLQVHPDDAYARRVEGQQGKNEMWYVVDAQPGARLILGFDRPVGREELVERIKDNTLLEVTRSVPVKAGDCYCVPAGLLHAIGGGVLIAEIQQNSNVTYRVYDFGRRDADGNLRELHVDKAVEVMDTTLSSIPTTGPLLADWPYFRTRLRQVDGEDSLTCGPESFCCILALEGTVCIAGGGEQIQLEKGSSAFLPAGIGRCQVTGRGLLLETAMA